MNIYDLIVLIYIFDYAGPQFVAQHAVHLNVVVALKLLSVDDKCKFIYLLIIFLKFSIKKII